MTKKLNFDDVRARIEKKGYSLLSKEYISGKEPLKIKCNTCNEERYSLIDNIDSKCKNCIKLQKISNKENEIKKLGFELLSDYKGIQSSIKVKCLANGHEFDIAPKQILKTKKCQYCLKKYENGFIKMFVSWLKKMDIE